MSDAGCTFSGASDLGSLCSWVEKRGFSAPPGVQFLSFSNRDRNSQNTDFLVNKYLFDLIH